MKYIKKAYLKLCGRCGGKIIKIESKNYWTEICEKCGWGNGGSNS